MTSAARLGAGGVCATGVNVAAASSSSSEEGSWRFDQLNGVARVTSADGSVYTGMFRNGVRQGCGRFQWPSGQIEDHLYSGGGLSSKIVYSGKNLCPDGIAIIGVAPPLPFLEAFLIAKSLAPALPEPSLAASSQERVTDPAVESLTGPLNLQDKLLVRAIDETHAGVAKEALEKIVGKPVDIKMDWESINKGDQPRRSVYTLDFEKSIYVLQPLIAAIANVVGDNLGAEAFKEQTKVVLLRQSSALKQVEVVVEPEGVLVIIGNFEHGRGSTLDAEAVKKAIEKAL